MKNIREISLPTQLLLKNKEVLQGNNFLVIGGTESELFTELGKAVFFNFDYSNYRKLVSELGASNFIQFGSWYTPKRKHDAVILYLPKSEPLIRMVLALISQVTEVDGRVYVVGQKNEGIKSQASTIEEHIGPIEYSESARHSTIYKAVMQNVRSEQSNLENWMHEYQFELYNKTYRVVSLPGVFSYGRLDEGTRLLLQNLKVSDGSKMLDWGCGSGVIGLVVKSTIDHVKVDMVDSNALAIEASKLTLALNGLDTQRIFLSDVFSDVKDQYDLIVSNPPFHSGVGTDYSMVERFIQQAKNHLRPQGRLLIVANSFLKYKPLIEKAFGNYKTIAETPAYRVHEAIHLV